MTDPSPPYTQEQLEEASKKDLVTFIQENASSKFLAENKLKGTLKNIAKMKTKDALILDYNTLFETKDFKKEGEEDAQAVEKVTVKTEKLSVKEKVVEAPKYVKHILKKGEGKNFPSKGDMISCWYTGKLDDNTVFDQNVVSEKKFKKAQPLRFKVGKGHVIRGWDEAIQTMSVGEKAQVIIESEWAYGKKGCEPKIPPNSRLTFEIELAGID